MGKSNIVFVSLGGDWVCFRVNLIRFFVLKVYFGVEGWGLERSKVGVEELFRGLGEIYKFLDW